MRPSKMSDLVNEVCNPWQDTQTTLTEEVPEVVKQFVSKHPHMNHGLALGKLIGAEAMWAKNQPYLLSCGYQLRPRYRPDWRPSWWNHHDGPLIMLRPFEDALFMLYEDVMDAVRVSDGSQVVIKQIDNRRAEVPLVTWLTEPDRTSNARNRTVRALDTFPMPGDESQTFLVIPRLQHFALLPFRRLGEFAEAVTQFIEGLGFLHEHGIAHRDMCYGNLMMDGSRTIPDGNHFFRPHTHNGVLLAKFNWKEHWSVRPVQYYFIDLGLPCYYPEDAPLETITGLNGQDRTVPELLRDVPYDPFKVDIYQLGNALLQVINEYDGLKAFLPLVQAMTNPNPMDRLSPAAALNLFGPFDDQTLAGYVRLKKPSLFDRLNNDFQPKGH
ncbi:hypothetical protein DXG01_017059 [Tephrocybe rancida]|nr:hypothetical protein DXG01_017059 [Tephrocybe rancida]